jgi:hypothetical protein
VDAVQDDLAGDLRQKVGEGIIQKRWRNEDLQKRWRNDYHVYEEPQAPEAHTSDFPTRPTPFNRPLAGDL